MYIQKVKLQNFRSFGDEGICFLFNKGINAVIGENNNGKTALIDAIRIAFSCVLYGENPEWCEMAEQPQEDGDEMESGFLFGSFFVAFSGVIRMGMD